MELNKPTERIAHMATDPLPIIAIKTRTAAVSALNARALPGLIFCMTAAPTKRPTIAPPQ